MLTVEEQLKMFRDGFPWMNIIAPATPGNGIHGLDEKQKDEAILYASRAEVNGKCKFVPASGAASRMFKDIFSGIEKPNEAVEKLRSNIDRFAFYDPWKFGEADPASYMLSNSGLGYGSKPKGVIRFHRYPDGECRTAFAEHLVEGQAYMREPDGTVNITFTISPEHRPLFEEALAEVKQRYEQKYGVRYNIRFTYQDPDTDTVAVDEKGNVFLKDDGTPLRRPAGHGALIYNLDAVQEELVSIKNIDNVAQERFLPLISRYKQVLMGCALQLRDRIFAYLRALDNDPGGQLCDEIEDFLRKQLSISLPPLSGQARRERLHSVLDRPIRVCGMVRNQGEPGGGPFIIRDAQLCDSLQILESVQIDKDDPHSAAALAASTHFNPVDIVCCMYNYKGEKFSLTYFVDPQAGFISSKSYEGRPLRALELPGLWNGAMSRWNTMFVEVPLETFNPVKTVNDLLREAHQ